MSQSFPNSYEKIAESMGITLWQRFSLNEASLFLRCQVSEVEELMKSGKLNCIEITSTEFQFFGYQLLEHLLSNVTNNDVPVPSNQTLPERIMRAKEVVEMTGLSRTTLWRMEKTGDFPARVSLGVGSVGWKHSEVSEWLKERHFVG
jgi:predicted DNA-binding transcriptional regulator AlpA